MNMRQIQLGVLKSCLTNEAVDLNMKKYFYLYLSAYCFRTNIVYLIRDEDMDKVLRNEKALSIIRQTIISGQSVYSPSDQLIIV